MDKFCFSNAKINGIKREILIKPLPHKKIIPRLCKEHPHATKENRKANGQQAKPQENRKLMENKQNTQTSNSHKNISNWLKKKIQEKALVFVIY